MLSKQAAVAAAGAFVCSGLGVLAILGHARGGGPLDLHDHEGVEPCLVSPPSDAERAKLRRNPSFVSAVERFRKMDRFAMVPSNPADKNSKPVLKPLGPLAACFAEGTPNEIMKAFLEALSMAPDGGWPRPGSDREYWLGSRWSGSQGSPRTITWSFVPDGTSISSGTGEPVANSNLFARMDALFGAANRATWIAKFQECFDRWSALTGATYTRVKYNGNEWDDGASWGSAGSAGLRGDVRISMKNIDGGSGILAYNYYPSNGDMVLDSSESWNSSSNNYRFMRNIVMHEHGHGMGLAHICSNNSAQLLEPYLSTTFDGPQHDDVRAMQRHYGDKFEIDDTVAQAFDAGTTDFPYTNTFGSATGASDITTRSIDANGDVDWIKFTLTKDARVTLVLAPVGYTYDDNQQSSNGSCPSGSSTNSRAIADLQFEIRDSTGTTVIASAASAAAGLSETLSNVELAAGSYTIRILEGNTPTQSQLYTLAMTVATNPAKTISGKVALQDYVGSVTAQPVAVSIRKPGSGVAIETKTVSLAADGSYSATFSTSLVSGNYDIVAKASHWLRERKASIAVSSAGATNVNFSLINGDVDGDNTVTVFDYNALSDAFDSAPGNGNWNANADLDGDGSVTVFDYNILSNNFDLEGSA